ncbi:hypothetical protein M758_3G184800 [Ceratodon purpureus]|nr:hypothetical protein M758_3G184800 [Ceratodon purpureus]
MATMGRTLIILSILAVLLAPNVDALRRLRDHDRDVFRPPCKAGIVRGPSSSQDAYLVPYPNTTEAKFVAVLSVGDSAANGYKLIGIPDGLGAYNDDDEDGSTFFVLMNHEDTPPEGKVHAHGAKGAFVSKWAIKKSSLEVVHGEDLIQHVWAWDRSTKQYLDPASHPPVVMQRFCSATLPAQSALFNRESGKGTRDLVFLNGEENGNVGRAYAHVVTGPMKGHTFELPHFAQAGFENLIPNPNLHKLDEDDAADKTVVMATDDNGHNRVFVYVGDKKRSGTPVEKAGLVGGKLYVIYLENIGDEIRDGGNLVAGDKIAFTATLLGDMSGPDGAGPALAASSLPVVNPNPSADPKNTKFDRPEDGNWHPEDPNVFYFHCTATFNAVGRHTRLWQLKFEDPTLRTSVKGVATVLINGPAGADVTGPKMLDNMGINQKGEAILQEDVGKQEHLSRVWKYNLKSQELKVIGQHNPAFFSPPTPVKTIDEESSGVIPMDDIMGKGWWMLDVQAHKPLGDDLVEDGQLLALYTGKCKGRD